MTVSIKSPTSTTGSIQLNGSDVLTIESDNSVDIDSNTLHVDATNNRIGVGTSSPSEKVEITTNGTNQLRISDFTGDGWEFRAGTNLLFKDDDVERMRINASGRVGINVTNPLAVLHIKGNNNPTSYFQVDSNGNQAIIFKNASNTTVGNITVNASTTAYNTSSDYRLKNNVALMSGSIDRLKQLKPSTWSWTQDGSYGEGFIAHEAQEVVPEAVTGTKDAMRIEEYEVTPAVLDDNGNVVTEAVMGTREVPDYQGIDQAKLVPLLTAALQEAITKIENLETRIEALEAK
jgi:hypothetical protein